MEEIIARMDQSAVKETEIIKLKYGVATDVVEMLKTLKSPVQVKVQTLMTRRRS